LYFKINNITILKYIKKINLHNIQPISMTKQMLSIAFQIHT